MSRVVRYNGLPGVVRLGDLALQPGSVVTGPEDVVAYLLTRSDCEAVGSELATPSPAPEPASESAPAAEED